MRLEIREDGLGYDEQGTAYWRGQHRWFRAYFSPMPVAISDPFVGVWTGSNGRVTRVVYRHGDDDHVYICEVA